jgi:hypothetical protein
MVTFSFTACVWQSVILIRKGFQADRQLWHAQNMPEEDGIADREKAISELKIKASKVQEGYVMKDGQVKALEEKSKLLKSGDPEKVKLDVQINKLDKDRAIIKSDRDSIRDEIRTAEEELEATKYAQQSKENKRISSAKGASFEQSYFIISLFIFLAFICYLDGINTRLFGQESKVWHLFRDTDAYKILPVLLVGISLGEVKSKASELRSQLLGEFLGISILAGVVMFILSVLAGFISGAIVGEFVALFGSPKPVEKT